MTASRAPSAAPPLPLRAKPLPRRIPEPVQLRHIQSSTREPCRRRSRELVDVAMREFRASVADIAEALDVDTRAAGRALTGEKPIDLGDVIAIARAGSGSLRLVRRILVQLRDELDRIEADFVHT